jgi:hypothetical protein
MTNKITAEEARELAGPSVQERVDTVYPLIREAAVKKLRRVALRDSFWTDGGYGSKPDWKKACDLLRKDGFKVDFYYSEGSQFVDMYTVVEW